MENALIGVEHGTVAMRLAPGRVTGHLLQEVDVADLAAAGVGLLRFSAEVRGIELDSSEVSPRGGRMVLTPHKSDGRLNFRVRHLVEKLFGTTSWRRASRLFRIESDTRRVSAGLISHSRGGELEWRNPELFTMRERSWSRLAWWTLLASWIALLATGTIILRGQLAGRRHLLVFSIAAVAIACAVVPYAWVTTRFHSVFDAIAEGRFEPAGATTVSAKAEAAAARDHVPAPAPTHVASSASFWNVAHVLTFASLALACSGGRRGASAVVAIAACLIIAVATEALQMFTIDRAAGLLDIGIDLTGMALGLVLAAGARWIRGDHLAAAASSDPVERSSQGCGVSGGQRSWGRG